VQLLEVVQRRVGRTDRVSPLVHVVVDPQAVGESGRPHELPHSGRLDAGRREGLEAGLDHGEVDQILGHAAIAQLAADHVPVESLPGQELLERRTLVTHEAAHPAGHAVVDFDGQRVAGRDFLQRHGVSGDPVVGAARARRCCGDGAEKEGRPSERSPMPIRQSEPGPET
jgi:hypothetical protein